MYHSTSRPCLLDYFWGVTEVERDDYVEVWNLGTEYLVDSNKKQNS